MTLEAGDALVVGGAVLTSSASTRSVTTERERLEKQVAELTAQAAQSKKDETANAQSRQAAADVYRMMTTLPGNERLKGVDQLAKLDTSRLAFCFRTSGLASRTRSGCAFLAAGAVAMKSSVR